MEKQLYFIKIGTIILNDVEYQNRCLSQNLGENDECIQSNYIPWKNTEYKPYDFKYENGEFILDIIIIPEPQPEPTDIDRISAQLLYTATMTDTLLGGINYVRIN